FFDALTCSPELIPQGISRLLKWTAIRVQRSIRRAFRMSLKCQILEVELQEFRAVALLRRFGSSFRASLRHRAQRSGHSHQIRSGHGPLEVLGATPAAWLAG